jgi:hypothetical protein
LIGENLSANLLEAWYNYDKYMKTTLEDGLGVVDNMEGNEQFGWAALLQ